MFSGWLREIDSNPLLFSHLLFSTRPRLTNTITASLFFLAHCPAFKL